MDGVENRTSEKGYNLGMKSIKSRIKVLVALYVLVSFSLQQPCFHFFTKYETFIINLYRWKETILQNY